MSQPRDQMAVVLTRRGTTVREPNGVMKENTIVACVEAGDVATLAGHNVGRGQVVRESNLLVDIRQGILLRFVKVSRPNGGKLLLTHQVTHHENDETKLERIVRTSISTSNNQSATCCAFIVVDEKVPDQTEEAELWRAASGALAARYGMTTNNQMAGMQGVLQTTTIESEAVARGDNTVHLLFHTVTRDDDKSSGDKLVVILDQCGLGGGLGGGCSCIESPVIEKTLDSEKGRSGPNVLTHLACERGRKVSRGQRRLMHENKMRVNFSKTSWLELLRAKSCLLISIEIGFGGVSVTSSLNKPPIIANADMDNDMRMHMFADLANVRQNTTARNGRAAV
ncbi:hypothetical protein EI94DRAFT_1912875 [Lactarius quietus]|nr:hypothetical protein EI94DRAFT_1912875 [Lactarius quietus]